MSERVLSLESEIRRLTKAGGWHARRTRVYFIQVDVADGPVKIGLADDPRKRLADLQCASPYDLRLIGHFPACVGVETWLHEQFGYCRLRGEWFRPDSYLLDCIAELLCMFKSEVFV